MLKSLRRQTGNSKSNDKDSDWQEKNSRLVALVNARKVDEALEVGHELLHYVDKKHKKDAREKATTYNNIGMAFLLAREYALAEECFREALAMRKRLFGDNHNEVAVILLNLVQLYKVQAQEILSVNRVSLES